MQRGFSETKARGAHGPSGERRERERGDGSVLRDGLPASAPSIEDVIGFDALWDSMEKCKKGVIWKGSVASFYMNGAEQVYRLSKELHDGTYEPRDPVKFRVTSPKEREILGIPFRDRIYQRSLNDNVLYPIMSKSWIYDNAACQTGKGTDFARNRFKCFLERHFRKHDIGGGVLSVDVKGYYPNMRHEVAENCLARRLPSWAAEMACRILSTQYEGEIGYNPGSQMVQIAGVSVLSDLDHVVKERLRVKHYARYMDDMRLVHEDLDYLVYCLYVIEQELSYLGFEVNPKKTGISLLTDNIPYLGFEYRLLPTGKVVMKPNQEIIDRMRHKIPRLIRLEKLGFRPEGTTDMAYSSWRTHILKGDSVKLASYYDYWYADLWRDAR